MSETTPSPLNNVITIDDDRIKNHGSVQTLSHIWFGLSGARQWLTQ